MRTVVRRGMMTFAALGIIFTAARADEPLPHWTPGQDIVDYLDKQPHHTVFVAALKASGLRAKLRGPGRFTVLAPTDAAFAQLPPGMVRDLMKPSSRAQLTQLIGCHIIAHEIKFGFRPIAAQPVMTLGGCALRFSRDEGDIHVHDENGIVAKLLLWDVFEANGQIEVIDGVLTPRLAAVKARYGAKRP